MPKAPRSTTSFMISALPREYKVLPARRANRVRKENKVRLVQQDRRENREYRVKQVQLAHKALKESKALPVRWAQPGRREKPDQLDRKANKACKAPLGLRGRKAHPVKEFLRAAQQDKCWQRTAITITTPRG